MTQLIRRIPTDRPNYSIKVTVNYNDGSGGRLSSRGYWGSVYLVKDEGNYESSALMSAASKRVMLQATKRYNENQFLEIIFQAENDSIPELLEAIEVVKLAAPNQSW